MPQPLSRVAPNANAEIGNVGMRSIRSRPALALLAIEVISTWSHVENFMLRLYLDMAGGHETDAAAVYLAMDTANAKTKVVTTLAERRLSPDNQKLLRAILRLVKSYQLDRDKLAHWIWGTSPDLPDAVLLFDPRHVAMTRDKIFVYRENDFEASRQKFERLAHLGSLFRFVIGDHPANREGRLYAQLCAEPEIAGILNRLAEPAILPPEEWPEWMKPDQG